MGRSHQVRREPLETRLDIKAFMAREGGAHAGSHQEEGSTGLGCCGASQLRGWGLSHGSGGQWVMWRQFI